MKICGRHTDGKGENLARKPMQKARFARSDFSEIAVGSRTFWLARKPIKNMYVRVKPPDGRIEVTAPLRMPLVTIEKFIATRSEWITQAQQEVIAQYSRETQSTENSTDTFSQHDQAASKAIINERLETLLPYWTHIIGKAPSAVSLRYMKTRWGSCTPQTRRIRLNLRLASMPERFLEYVVVHELTHLHVGGHGAAFQHRMDEYLPNWRTLRRELNKFVVA